MKILFIDGTKAFSPRRLGVSPTGGIVTSLTIIPQGLAALHDVTVCSLHPVEETIGGVKYLPIDGAFIKTRPDFDVVVFNRNAINRAAVEFFPNAKKVLWLHDIVDPRYFDDDAFRYVDRIVALSGYCRESYNDFYSIPNTKFRVIQNGVDKDVFFPTGGLRNPNLYICASAPIKGLQPLDFLYVNMKRINPDFELRLYCSQSLHDLEDDPAYVRQLNRLRERGITVLDPVPQEQLAHIMREAWCLVMPGHYPEICSNLLLQAQASGLPVCGSNVGSMPEFIAHRCTGLITDVAPSDLFWWWKQFTENAALLYKDRELHRFISEESPKYVPSWKVIRDKWADFISDLTVDKSQFTNTTNNLITLEA